MRPLPHPLSVVLLALLLSTLAGCWGPLIDAAREGNTQRVRTLLDQGYKDASGMAFFQACCYGKTETVQLLLERGANPSTVSPDGAFMYGTSALQCAAMDGYAPTVALQLQYGADREYKDAHGRTALEMARGKGYTAVVKILEETPTTPTATPPKRPAPAPSAESPPPPPIY